MLGQVRESILLCAFHACVQTRLEVTQQQQHRDLQQKDSQLQQYSEELKQKEAKLQQKEVVLQQRDTEVKRIQEHLHLEVETFSSVAVMSVNWE